MIVELWASQIVLGKKTFKQVPIKLKELVKEKLIEKGHEELVTE